jgi:hypothetical protein
VSSRLVDTSYPIRILVHFFCGHSQSTEPEVHHVSQINNATQPELLGSLKIGDIQRSSVHGTPAQRSQPVAGSAHGKKRRVFVRIKPAFSERLSNQYMRRRTDRADRDPFAFQFSDPFCRRFRNQHMERPIKPAHDGFNWQALNRRNRGGTGNRRVIQLSRQQRRYLYSDSNGDFSDFEFFLVVKSSSFGNLARLTLGQSRRYSCGQIAIL